MIFLTVTVLGVLVGLLVARLGPAGALAPDAAGVAGAAGAFVAGCLVVGLTNRHLPFDPVVLAVGALTAAAFVLAVGWLGEAGGRRDRPEDPKMGSGLHG